MNYILFFGEDYTFLLPEVVGKLNKRTISRNSNPLFFARASIFFFYFFTYIFALII